MPNGRYVSLFYYRYPYAINTAHNLHVINEEITQKETSESSLCQPASGRKRETMALHQVDAPNDFSPA